MGILGAVQGRSLPWLPAALLWGGVAAAVALLFAGGKVRIALAAALLLAAGGLDFTIQDRLLRRDLLAGFAGREVSLTAMVCGPPQVREGRCTVPLRTEAVSCGGRDFPVEAVVLARIARAPSPPLRWGERLRGCGVLERPSPLPIPGGFDHREHLARRGIHHVFRIAGRSPPARLGYGNASPLLAFPYRVREKYQDIARSSFPEPLASFFLGIVLGDSGSLPGEVVEAFRETGTLHILAASGMNVAVVASFIVLVAGICGVSRRSASVLAIPLVMTYAVMAGASPSVLRAAVMCILALTAFALGRESDVFHFLVLAALGMTAARPYYLLDVSFQLSFAAVAGLVFLSGPIERRFPFLPRALRVPLAVSLATQAALWPILAYCFQQLSLVTVVANLAIVPAAELLLPLGLLQGLLGAVWLPLSTPLVTADYFLMTFLLKSAAFFHRLPFSFFPMKPPPPAFLAAYYCALFLPFTGLSGRPGFPVRALSLSLWGLALLLLLWGSVPAHPRSLQAVFFDVGQADAALFRFPGGGTMLIDGGGVSGGGDSGKTLIAPYLVREGVGRLDLLVLTHPHLDHMGGMLSLIRSVPVRFFGESGMTVNDRAYSALKRELQVKNVPQAALRRGDRWVFDGGAVVVLRGADDLPETRIRGPNDASLVVQISCGPVSFLMMGDLERRDEERLVREGRIPPCTVLKVGHQGSATSTCRALLAAAAPRCAVISVGRNRFGHPSRQVLERLQAHGVATYRTDQGGAVFFEVEGGRLSVRTTR